MTYAPRAYQCHCVSLGLGCTLCCISLVLGVMVGKMSKEVPGRGFCWCVHHGSSDGLFIGVRVRLWVGFSPFHQGECGGGWHIIIIDHKYVVIYCSPCLCVIDGGLIWISQGRWFICHHRTELMGCSIKVNFPFVRCGDFCPLYVWIFLLIQSLDLGLFVIHQLIPLLHLVVPA